jgi:C4-dicarboxylate transporter, DctM subunit
MSWIIIVGLIFLAALGAPLFAVFGAAAMLLFDALADTPITGATNDVFSEKFADSPLLVTIPLFTFAGYLMAESGTPRRLVELSRAWLGWLPGGLALVCIIASSFFTTFTGGSGITIVAIGGLLYPALVSERYPERFSLGLVTTGGSLGLLFPPSVPIVLYGVVAGITIEGLFAAGFFPGIVTLAALGGYSMWKAGAIHLPRTRFVMRDALKALWVAKWEAAIPVVLVLGMGLGILRLHEASAFTALYVLVIEVFVYRDVRFTKDLPRIIRDSMTLVGAILIILATAIGFTSYLIQAEVPMKILEAMQTFITSKWMFLLLLNVFLIGVGMLMDIFSAIVVVVPLIIPIARSFGVDPFHLGIVFLLNLEIGYMTPPVGLNLFISSFRFGKPVTELYRAVLPFIGLLLVALAIVTYYEPLSTTLVDVMREKGLVPAETLRESMTDDEPIDFDMDLDDDESGDLDDLEDLDDLDEELSEDELDEADSAEEPESVDDLESEDEPEPTP